MLVLANLSARVADAHVLYLQKTKQTQKTSGTVSPSTSVYAPEIGQFSKIFVLPLLPLIYCWFFSSGFQNILIPIAQAGSSCFVIPEPAICFVCLSHISMVPISKTQIKKYCSLFLTAPKLVPCLLMLWFGFVFQGAMLLLSPFPPMKVAGSFLPPRPLSAGSSLEENCQCLSSLLSFKMAPNWLLRGVGGYRYFCSATSLRSLKHWGLVCLTCEGKASNAQPEA